MFRLKTSSAKAKGRRLQQLVSVALRSKFSLTEADIRSTPMGTQGEDVWLSQIARDKFPFSIECKNVEKINLWKSWAQADANCPSTLSPLLVIARNRTEPLAILRLEDLLNLFSSAR